MKKPEDPKAKKHWIGSGLIKISAFIKKYLVLDNFRKIYVDN